MRPTRLRFALLLLAASPAVTALGCADDADDVEGPTAVEAAPPTTEAEGVAVCTRAQGTVGAADPPTDLVTLAAEAARIADLATAPGEPLRSALVPVSDAAALLTEAARAQDPAAVADAAATLTAAYDELDLVAASMEAAECTSESWGRQVAIAAIDLVGAGG